MGLHPANIRIRHMRVLVEIARYGSLARAAQALHITQAAVSKSLRELETELDTRLVERSRKGSRLTAAGLKFHEHAIECLLSHGRAIASVRDAQDQSEDLRIGALPTAAGSIVPTALDRIYSDGHTARVIVRSGSYETLAAALRSNELDLIIGRMIPRDTKGLAFEALYREEIALVASPAHPIRKATMLTQDNLDNFATVIALPGTSVRSAVDDFLFLVGLRLGPIVYEAQSNEFAFAMTARHSALWFTPVGLVEEHLATGTLVRLDVEHVTLQATVGLTTCANDIMGAAAQRFADIVRDLAASRQSPENKTFPSASFHDRK